jgi:hypothetical protein
MWTKTLALAVSALTIVGALSMASASAGAAPQRIDMKVLLLGATGNEPSFAAWQAQLQREGVPFDAIVAGPGHAPITASTLSSTLADGTQEAKYQAVIVATGGLLTCSTTPCTSALSPAEWTALQTFEQTFHVRQLTAYAFPGADYGLNAPTFSGAMDGQTGSLTPSGAQTFPYLKGPVTIDTGTFGYQATPATGANFNTLLAGPNNSALVGVYTHPDGREEMVQTFDGNQYQLHSWLLRHGELEWVTRGTFLGLQRNYLELQVDDIFLPDDSWDATTHTTNYDPAAAIRMTPADVTYLSNWSRANGLRFDMVFNGGGSVAQAQASGGTDPLLSAFQAVKGQFGWINHTYDHPNLDCSTRPFIAREITDNTSWAQQQGLPVTPSELVTGEHSGLANLIPGNPGTIDPPSLDDATPGATGGTLAAGSYDYSVTGTTNNGESTGSTTTVTTTGSTGSVSLAWEAICHASSYKIYRRVSPSGAWSLVGTVAQPSTAFTDSGPVLLTFTDTGSAGTAASPPATNAAKIDPYAENPNFVGALTDAGVTSIASDASKPYPQIPSSTTGPQYPAGASFVDGPARAVPRYPTNVYYNVATQAQLVDEYNYLYDPPSLGGICVDTSTTTCQTAPSTWAQIMQGESDRIFGHMMGNDPRPHYFHQTNIAETGTADGGVLYPILDAVLADYARYFAANAPIVQLSHSDIANLLGEQSAWSAASAGQVSGYIEGSQVTIVNTGGAAVSLPLSGTEVGDMYGGTRSGWGTAPPGTSTHVATTPWPTTAPPATPPASPPVATTPVGHAAAPSAPLPVRSPSVAAPPITRSRRAAPKKRAKVVMKCVKRRRVVRGPHGKRRVVVVRVCRPVRRHVVKHRRHPAAKVKAKVKSKAKAHRNG